MAELADAHGSGPCEGNFMGVRIPLSAPKHKDAERRLLRFLKKRKVDIGIDFEHLLRYI